jgi:ATP synthase mitochondrial F1 complex assembly factor 1
MSAVSIPTTAIRHSVRATFPFLRPQRRHARVHDIRFVTTQQKSRSVLEKYKEKLEQKAKQYALLSVHHIHLGI